MMNKRETALEIIRIEFAKHGKATPTSTRAYVENRISWMAYNRAVKRGMDIYMANAPKVEQFDGVVDRASDHSEYLEYKREITEIDEKSAQEES